jgi:hypothetical protein
VKKILFLTLFLFLAGVTLAQAQIPNQQEAPPATETPTPFGTPVPSLTPTKTPNNNNPTNTPKPKFDEGLQGVYNLPPIWALERLDSLEIVGLPALAQLDAPDPLLDAIDAVLPDIWVQVLVIQMDYNQQSDGHYIQGLWSHTTPPTDGENVWPDNALAAPSDFPANWLDTDILPYSPSPYRYSMDVYDGPNGTGFTFCLQTSISGITWEKCYNYGGELWKAHDWEQVIITEP